MLQFTKKWNWEWIVQVVPEVPDLPDSNQNDKTACNSKFKFTELKDLFIKRVQGNFVERHIFRRISGDETARFHKIPSLGNVMKLFYAVK